MVFYLNFIAKQSTMGKVRMKNKRVIKGQCH